MGDTWVCGNHKGVGKGILRIRRAEKVVDVVLTGDGGDRGEEGRSWQLRGSGERVKCSLGENLVKALLEQLSWGQGWDGGGAGKGGFWAWGFHMGETERRKGQSEGSSKEKVATLNQKSVLCTKKRLANSHLLAACAAASSSCLLSFAFNSWDSSASAQQMSLLCYCALVHTSPDCTARKFLKNKHQLLKHRAELMGRNCERRLGASGKHGRGGGWT